jgi:hypothetical protein
VSARLSRVASLVVRAGLALTVLGALALLLSGLGSRWDWWDFRTGFVIFRFTLYGGLLVIVVVLAGLVLACLERTGRTVLLSLVSVVLLVVVASVPVSHLRGAGRVPPIHDITTDPDDPPRFVAVLPLRQHAPNSADYAGPELAAQQRAGYPDLAPAHLAAPPAVVLQRATEVARDLGWEIVATARAAGRFGQPGRRPLGLAGGPQRSRHQRSPDPALPRRPEDRAGLSPLAVEGQRVTSGRRPAPQSPVGASARARDRSARARGRPRAPPPPRPDR